MPFFSGFPTGGSGGGGSDVPADWTGLTLVTAVAGDTLKIVDATDGAFKKVNASDFLSGVADNSITNAKLSDVATATIKGRSTAGTGDPEDLTAAQVRTLLNVSDGATNNSTILANEVTLDNVPGATYTSLQDMNDQYHSSGVITGGVITDAGAGAVNVTAGTGWIKDVDSDIDTLFSTDWSLASNLTLTDNALNYVFVSYNAGSPVIQANVTEPNWNTNIKLGTVHRSGTTLHISSHTKYTVANHAKTMITRLQNTMKFARASGGVLTATGTRNIAISQGSWWEGLNNFITNAFDSSIASTFSYWYRDGASGFTEIASQTQINNTQYDNGTGTLATLANNQYGVHWVYIDADSEVHVIFGRDSYTSTTSESATPPSTTPGFFTDHSRLVGKIIIQKDAVAFTSIGSVFTNSFSTTSGLQNVADDLTPQLGGNLDAQTFNIDNVSDLATDTITADSTSGGIQLRNNAGTAVVSIGVGGASSTTITLNGATSHGGNNITGVGSITGNTSLTLASTSNNNIIIDPNGTGNVQVGNYTFDGDQTVGAGQDNYVLTYDNGTGLISLEASAGGSSTTLSFGTATTTASNTIDNGASLGQLTCTLNNNINLVSNSDTSHYDWSVLADGQFGKITWLNTSGSDYIVTFNTNDFAPPTDASGTITVEDGDYATAFVLREGSNYHYLLFIPNKAM